MALPKARGVNVQMSLFCQEASNGPMNPELEDFSSWR